MPKQLFAAAFLVACLLAAPVIVTEIDVHGYASLCEAPETGICSISAMIDGTDMTVPDDMANRHRQLIRDLWEAKGNVIPQYEPPSASTDPDDYPLQRYQFLAMLEIAGLKPMVEIAIDKLPDAVDRAVARARYESTDAFDRDDPLLVQMAGAAGLSPKQVDALWMQAKDL